MFFLNNSLTLKVLWYMPTRKFKQNKFSIVTLQVNKGFYLFIFFLFVANFQAYLLPLIQEPP